MIDKGQLTDEDRECLDGRTVVLSVSGGKDSTATGLWLKESSVAFRAVHMDTGWEHPLTEAYVRETLPGVLGVPVDIVSPKCGGFAALCRKKGMFPHRTIRFCTQELKIKPFEHYCQGIDGSIANAIGIRAGESKARANLPRWSVEAGVDTALLVWRPLINWSFDDVAEIHRKHGVMPNPLYLRYGVSRVGCWPCIYARKAEIAAIAKHDPDRIGEIELLEADIQRAAQLRYEAKGETVESLGYHPPTMFSRAIPGTNRVGMTPIRDVVKWAQTGRGGRQMLLDIPPEPGCVRWGMCEHVDD